MDPYAGNVFARRLREVRERRGWSQTELVERLDDYGRPFHRTTIGKMETHGHSKARNVSVEDVLAIAAVLGVAPVHLIVPLDDEERFQVAPKVNRDARTAREWIRGRGMVSDTNFRLFWSEQPEHERRAQEEQAGPGTPTDLTPSAQELRDEHEEKN